MRIADVMTKDPILIRPDARLREALGTMATNQISHLPVVNSTGGLVGILSNRDCRRALNAPYLSDEEVQDSELANHIRVRSIMSPAPIVIEPTKTIIDAAQIMMEHQIGSLPVLQSETIVGIITRTDLLAAFCRMVQGFGAA